MEQKFLGGKVSSMELSFPGAKVRGNESSVIYYRSCSCSWGQECRLLAVSEVFVWTDQRLCNRVGCCRDRMLFLWQHAFSLWSCLTQFN